MSANCPYCDLKFVNGGGVAFNKHVKKHLEGNYKKFQCDVCDKILATNYSLKYHKKQHEDEDTRVRYQCSICNSTFTDEYYKNIHEKKHTRPKPEEYKPPSDFHKSLKPKYIIYVRNNKQIIRCLGVYASLSEAVEHTGCGKDSLQNLYLDNGRKSKLSKVLVMHQLPKNDYFYKQQLDENKTIDFN